jgi:hypothetical protein
VGKDGGEQKQFSIIHFSTELLLITAMRVFFQVL